MHSLPAASAERFTIMRPDCTIQVLVIYTVIHVHENIYGFNPAGIKYVLLTAPTNL